MSEIRQGDWGTVIRLTIKEGGAVRDVSDAVVKQILIALPGKTEVAYAATFTTDGTDGRIQWIVPKGMTEPNSACGQWAIRGYYENATGGWYTQKRYQGVARRDV